jgi:hypothetical protein
MLLKKIRIDIYRNQKYNKSMITVTRYVDERLLSGRKGMRKVNAAIMICMCKNRSARLLTQLAPAGEIQDGGLTLVPKSAKPANTGKQLR